MREVQRQVMHVQEMDVVALTTKYTMQRTTIQDLDTASGKDGIFTNHTARTTLRSTSSLLVPTDTDTPHTPNNALHTLLVRHIHRMICMRNMIHIDTVFGGTVSASEAASPVDTWMEQ